MNFWAQRVPEKNNAFDPAVIRLLPLPRVRGTKGCEKSSHRMLAPDNWDAYERSDFSEPSSCIFPYILQRSDFPSLTITFWCSDYLLPVASVYITWYSLSPNFLGPGLWVTWDAVSWAWSPKNFHRIKPNSQPVGCHYFLSRQACCVACRILVPQPGIKTVPPAGGSMES